LGRKCVIASPSTEERSNDKREGNIDDLLNLEKEGCVTKVVDEYIGLNFLRILPIISSRIVKLQVVGR